jgi:hypothetical protein
VIVGGALGAAMTRNLNCEDRSYAYKTYYDGFNSGRPNSTYQWRNPNNGHYGNSGWSAMLTIRTGSAARITDRKFHPGPSADNHGPSLSAAGRNLDDRQLSEPQRS